MIQTKPRARHILCICQASILAKLLSTLRGVKLSSRARDCLDYKGRAGTLLTGDLKTPCSACARPLESFQMSWALQDSSPCLHSLHFSWERKNEAVWGFHSPKLWLWSGHHLGPYLPWTLSASLNVVSLERVIKVQIALCSQINTKRYSLLPIMVK